MNEERVSSDFLRVLLALAEKIEKDLSVAEVCKVLQKNSDGSFLCKILSTGQNVEAEVRWKLTVTPADIVLIVFCDHNYKNNLFSLRHGDLEKEDSIEGELLHEKSYGVITDLIYTTRKCDANGDLIENNEEETING